MKERHDSMMKSGSIHRDKSTSSLDQLSKGRPPYQSQYTNQSQKQLNDISLKGIKNVGQNQNLIDKLREGGISSSQTVSEMSNQL
mmetsp:Transcript_9681/g.7315  ORF Transcript_9681/g.7315 Transcript_9681/m.7315 type:complete len:85 (+) Transcript_9681:40-294(+)